MINDSDDSVMYSHNESIKCIQDFYREILRHPYLNEDALVTAPTNGWDITNVPEKNETVIDLLRHLPYMRSGNQYRRLLIHWETIPICYCDNAHFQEIYALPSHCVYLTQSVDREGTNLILDTADGTITEYSHVGYHITVPNEEYEALLEAERWRVHRTTPVTEFFEAWRRKFERLVWMLVPNPIGQPATGRFYSRGTSDFEDEALVLQTQLQPWHPRDDPAGNDDESEFDREQREARNRERKHTAASTMVYFLCLKARDGDG
ncbi:hypothetical protein O1611_g6065 [Lasiodiplodia mahajangana]|uniref:Uncharacterized protein n=1 Tax=Lasiodiplodia mahajangana TaxID=1108764 RepID=A0ACC2JJW7_9PEZI|nr:hypothetical protein O1611_g6065 [Lasiodiplodia mahajangana]